MKGVKVVAFRKFLEALGLEEAFVEIALVIVIIGAIALFLWWCFKDD